MGDEAYERKLKNDEANRQSRLKEMEDQQQRESMRREADRQKQEQENLKHR